MPFGNLLKIAARTCSFCRQKVGILTREHPECRRTFQEGWNEMVRMAAAASCTRGFDEKSLRLLLADIAESSYGDGHTINQALEEGWKQGVTHSMADGILTQAEESRLREFRDRLALDSAGTDQKATAQLEIASTDRLTLDARLAAVAVDDPDTHLSELTESLRQSSLNPGQQTALLVRAWEAAVEGSPEDGLLTLDEENALARYMEHFSLTSEQLNRNGVQTTLVQAAVIRDIAEGIVPQRQNITGRVPFNLMKSETLVWVMDEADYYETVTRRERRGSSHGLSIRVARGVYYRPGTFRSRNVEWDETVHQDTGLLGFTTKHLYFSGSKKKFRVRYDRIVDLEPFSDGFGIMREAQTAKPQAFKTGDGWFAFNLATNLAQM